MADRIFYDGKYKPLAQKLRREMTRQEKHLWYDYLKPNALTFRRQKQFGSYIVDFYCAAARLAIELDGSQHYEPSERREDEARDRCLAGMGVMTLRFSNADVDQHFESVCLEIEKVIAARIK